MKILAAVAVALAALTVSACSGGAPANPSPTPTVVVASEKQVASVVAEYAADWQEVIDTASECRLAYVMGGDAATEYTCKTREETIGITAGLALRDLRALNVPSSMESLVADTDDVLTSISGTDLTSLCGDDGWKDAPDCSSALADRYAAYTRLDSQLAAWSPYL
ncbi:hypothetical protein NYQ35_16170 [Curtobacterium flaccumfaciens pv. flaccumfaciens]|uniref:hypothetical protein n=1 Tax=Curtobacterium flaccumfaciens TaxID=2035 RepID=UPI00217D0BFE|nr:hypothetical protein [Curtobacterium flaccumfaciens]MCS6570343.1 hypothetical protein [Curtobacterium flaccumfaciens pv. flaccumfaciens]MCS6585199.1 hypothetical protein [Curtobacterium flaccumfaciens pv. flaccumfaciens]